MRRFGPIKLRLANKKRKWFAGFSGGFKKNTRSNLTAVIMAAVLVLAGAGYIGAKNGWFGCVPERTAILLLLTIGIGSMLMVATSKRKNFSFGTAPKNPSRIAKLAIIAAIILTLGVGGTFALNGFFGGGAAVPEDTFTRGLAGYWSFDEGKGNVAYDASGNGNNGTLANGPKWTMGKNVGALKLDGKDDYVNCGNNTVLTPTDKLSVSFWVKLNKITGIQYIVSRGRDNYGSGYNVYAASNKIYAEINLDDVDDLPEIDIASLTTIAPNTWYYVSLTYDYSVGAALYINGIKETTSSLTGPIVYRTGQGNNLIIGSLSLNPSLFKFDGVIDDLRIYSRELSAAEVKYHYSHGGPVGYWNFDEGSGTSIKDSSGNNNDGMVSGAGWADGKIGGALNFDGSDDYVSIPNNSSLNINGAFTVSTWFKTTTSSKRILVKEGAGNKTNYSLQVAASGYLEGGVYDGVNNPSFANTARRVNDGDWHFATLVRDGVSKIYLYVDGLMQSANDTTVGNTITNSSPFIIGKRYSASGVEFNGSIDEPKIYNYARSAEEIRLDYQAGMAVLFGPSGKACDEDPASCMDKGLVAYWSFDENTGLAVSDAVENKIAGNLVGGTNRVVGKLSGALQFDGKDDYADYGSNQSLNLNVFTVETWVKVSGIGAGNFPEFYNRYSGSGTYNCYTQFGFNYTTHKFGGRINNGASGPQESITSNSAVDDGKWHHVVFVVSDTQLQLFLDGKSDATPVSRSITIGSSVGQTVHVGKYVGSYFKGFLDEMKIYNRPLLAEEIRYHYNQGGPVGYWAFDEGSGTKVADVSGNNNDGVINGATWTSGKYGSALSFNGASQYVDAGNKSNLNIGTNDFTYGVWFKANTMPVSQDSAIMNRIGSTSRAVISIHPDGRARFYIRDSDPTSLDQYTTGTYLDNQWHYAVLARTSTRLRGYIDSILVVDSDATNIGNIDVTSSLYFGKWGGYYFNGLIDEARAYNYARTADQIKQDYQAGVAVYLGPSGKTCSEDPAGCMDKGLVGYWDMDEGKGAIIADKSGNGNNGLLSNGPKWAAGHNGGALQFDGKDDYVNCGTSSSLDIVNDITIEAWIKIPAVLSNHQMIFNRGVTGTDGYQFLVYYNTGQLMVGTFNNNYQWFGGNSRIPVGTWAHVVFTRNNSNDAVLYINGVVDKVGTLAAPKSANRPALIGTTQYPPKGFIDDIRIYNRVLSAEEVRYHYNEGAPVAQWDMDEGIGTVIDDSSGNRNRCSISGASWVQGKFGSALSFDGVDDYAFAGNNSLYNFGTGNFSISTWIKTTSVGVGSYAGIVNNYKNPGFTNGWWIQQQVSTGYILFGWSGSSYLTGTKSINDGNWHHIMAVRDGDRNIKTYIDGVIDINGVVATGGSVGTNLLEIGGHYNNGWRFFNGLIDDVKIYNYARTADQVKMDYQQGVATHLE